MSSSRQPFINDHLLYYSSTIPTDSLEAKMNDDNVDNLSLLDNLEITDPQIKEQLDDLCTSSELSLTALQEILNRLDKNDIGNYTFDRIEGSCLHKACMNNEDVVTVDIIQLLLETFPISQIDN